MTALENHLLSALERLQDESQKQHNSYLQSVAELQERYNEIKNDYSDFLTRVNDLTTQLETLNKSLEQSNRSS